jgi:hypothetical protein
VSIKVHRPPILSRRQAYCRNYRCARANRKVTTARLDDWLRPACRSSRHRPCGSFQSAPRFRQRQLYAHFAVIARIDLNIKSSYSIGRQLQPTSARSEKTSRPQFVKLCQNACSFCRTQSTLKQSVENSPTLASSKYL